MTAIEVCPMTHDQMREVAFVWNTAVRFEREHIGDNVYLMGYLPVPDTDGRSVYKSDNIRCWLLNYGQA